MDKYLYLMRVYLRSAWTRLSMNEWADKVMLNRYLELLSEIPLNPSEPKIPDGMRYHVVDIYIDELEEVGLSKDHSDLIVKLVAPLDKLEKESHTKTVRLRVKEAKQDPRLGEWLGKTSQQVTAGNEDEDDEWGGLGT
jgi:ribosomal RNA-processing protein 1